MKTPVRILYLEDNPRDAERVRDKLQQTALACELHVAGDRAAYEAALAQTLVDLILASDALPNYSAMAALRWAQAQQPEVPFIVLAGTPGEERAVDGMLCGAADYVLKHRLDRLSSAVLRVLTKTAGRHPDLAADQAAPIGEQSYREIFNATNEAIALHDAATGRLLDVNDAVFRMCGYESKAEVLAGNIGELFADAPPYSLAEAQRHIRKAIEEGPEVFEWLAHKKNGERFWVEVSLRSSQIGGRGRILAVVRDITERKRADLARQASEELYRSLFSNMLNGFAYCRMLVEDGRPVDFVYLKVNERFEKLTGLRNVEGRRATEAIPGIRETDTPLFEIYGRVASTGQPEKFETYVEALKDWYLISVYCPQKGYFVAVFDVITERKRAEEALQHSEKRFRILFEQAADCILLLELTAEGHAVIRDANSATFRRLGYERDELIGQPVSSLDADFGASREVARQRQKHPAGSGTIFEMRHRCKDGAVRDFECSVSEIQIDAKPYAISVERDITERRRALESQARLATAVEQAAETIVITDTQGLIVYANPAFEKVTGYTRAEALGRNPRILKSDKHPADFYRMMWATLTAGAAWSGHMINKRKDGSLYEEEATISPVRDAAGGIVNYVAVKRDVTHEVQLEGHLRQAQKMEAVGRLAGGVAHDFNNLLMGIMGYAELSLDRIEPEHPIREWLKEIVSGAQRSSEITRQLLAFARKQAIEPKILDLNDAVAGMLKLLRRLIGEDLNLAWLPGANLHPVRIDPSQVDQILANLCVNARDAIAGVGTISLETGNAIMDEAYCAQHAGAIPGAYVLLSVSDDGCGMDAATLAQIFEPFFTTKGPGKGTGLGLATVYGIVKQNDGFIYASSEPGKGTTFRIYLPQVAAEPLADTVGGATDSPRGRGETILLVEDERSLRTTCSLFLEALGYKVLMAETPGEALQVSDRYRGDIHLLLTDVVMPGMGGRELAKRLGSARLGLRVLFMSGYAADVIAKRGALDLEEPFIAKPFTRHDLARKVMDVLGDKPQ